MDLSGLTAPLPRTTRAPAVPVEALVATTPATDAEGVFVLIGNGQQQTGPCAWMPRGTTRPARGDRCILDATLRGRMFLAWWGPDG
ncbi:MAG: hypothetical protein LC798_15545 [Chloroflexi bacterium]|nr:hypothetical protein [Chloroflexota bacterium]